MNLPAPPRWWKEAACSRLGVDPEIFFPHDGDKTAVEDAKAICRMCPVARECLIDAMNTEGRAGAAYRHGIRGSYTPKERVQVYRRFIAPRTPTAAPKKRTGGKKPSPCGTTGAYDRHVRLGEPIDDACRHANAEKERVRRANRRARSAAA